jgi:hypothetical protein
MIPLVVDGLIYASSICVTKRSFVYRLHVGSETSRSSSISGLTDLRPKDKLNLSRRALLGSSPLRTIKANRAHGIPGAIEGIRFNRMSEIPAKIEEALETARVMLRIGNPADKLFHG